MSHKKNSKLERSDLIQLSREDLIDKIIQLQEHNTHLKNIIAKTNQCDEPERASKPFDFNRVEKIHILLKLLYLGWDYQGYVVQEDTSNTIEHHLFKALLRCRLIESRETSNYHRCGRTDKGVTSFGQVISISVRAARKDEPHLNYIKMLNRLLPENIRAVSWCQIPDEFSARFDCKARIYRYFFPKANLNIEVMNEAAKNLIGTHDFRNLCKMDVGNGVTNFIRSIDTAVVEVIENSGQSGYEICKMELRGKAFLWHQVRCIMSVLLLVGQGLESSDIILKLFNVEKFPRKPQYPMASPLGLNLFSCEYEDVDWSIDPTELSLLIKDLQKLWAENEIKTVHIKSMLNHLECFVTEPVFEQISGLIRKDSKVYKPLLERHKCSSLEERIEHYGKKRKIDIKNTKETLST